MRHYTTNPARKAESIAYREEKLRERETTGDSLPKC